MTLQRIVMKYTRGLNNNTMLYPAVSQGEYHEYKGSTLIKV